MICLMAWLTVSLPIIYQFQDEKSQGISINDYPADQENDFPDSFPLGTTEEQTENGVKNSVEYLNDKDARLLELLLKTGSRHTGSDNLYIAFHGELLSPPPEA
jgi:hypothetical protein